MNSYLQVSPHYPRDVDFNNYIKTQHSNSSVDLWKSFRYI